MTQIRPARPSDNDEIFALYPQAFPDEDLLPLVSALLNEPSVISLVAEDGGRIVGHIVMSMGSANGQPVALLGPLGVHPDLQRQGIGGMLIRAGKEAVALKSAACVLVLGDPEYYGRHGFATERAISPPYALPEAYLDAWQSCALAASEWSGGTMSLPPAWMEPRWWV